MSNNQGAAPLENDPRWRRLHHRPWRCTSCALTHHGIFDITYGRPVAWPESDEPSSDSIVVTSSHFLSEDICVVEDQHFVRCMLELPIRGSASEYFAFGIWSSLSKPNFALYVETFDDGEQGALGPWFGWFSNRLRGYPDTFGLKCQVHPRSSGQRPFIEFEPADHPLARDQREGITLDRLLEIYAAHGHDLRSVLSDA
jgi:hypothetical protein